jgi:hypothetical protein
MANLQAKPKLGLADFTFRLKKNKNAKAGVELSQTHFKLGLAMQTSWVICLAKLPT